MQGLRPLPGVPETPLSPKTLVDHETVTVAIRERGCRGLRPLPGPGCPRTPLSLKTLVDYVPGVERQIDKR